MYIHIYISLSPDLVLVNSRAHTYAYIPTQTYIQFWLTIDKYRNYVEFSWNL